MVGFGNVVKIGDFGLARPLQGSDYYRFQRNGDDMHLFAISVLFYINYLTTEITFVSLKLQSSTAEF